VGQQQQASQSTDAQLIIAKLQSIVQEGLQAIQAHEGSSIGNLADLKGELTGKADQLSAASERVMSALQSSASWEDQLTQLTQAIETIPVVGRIARLLIEELRKQVESSGIDKDQFKAQAAALVDFVRKITGSVDLPEHIEQALQAAEAVTWQWAPPQHILKDVLAEMTVANLEGAVTEQLKLQIGADASQKLLEVVHSLMQTLAGEKSLEDFMTQLVETVGGGGILSVLQGGVSQLKGAWKAILFVLVTELMPIAVPVAQKVHAQLIKSATNVDPQIGEFVASVFPASAFDSIQIDPPAGVNPNAVPLALLAQVLVRRLLSSQHEAIENLGNCVVDEASTDLGDISVYLDQLNSTATDVIIEVSPAMGEHVHSMNMKL